MTPKGRGGFDHDQTASAGNTAESTDIRKSPADQPGFTVISGGAKTELSPS
jgi:hypothetical protein